MLPVTGIQLWSSTVIIKCGAAVAQEVNMPTQSRKMLNKNECPFTIMILCKSVTTTVSLIKVNTKVSINFSWETSKMCFHISHTHTRFYQNKCGLHFLSTCSIFKAGYIRPPLFGLHPCLEA